MRRAKSGPTSPLSSDHTPAVLDKLQLAHLEACAVGRPHGEALLRRGHPSRVYRSDPRKPWLRD